MFSCGNAYLIIAVIMLCTERERVHWFYEQGDPLCPLQMRPALHNLSADTQILSQNSINKTGIKTRNIVKLKVNQVENHALSSSDLQVSVLAASRIQKPSLKARTFSTTSF